jgi:hypothetical protein
MAEKCQAILVAVEFRTFYSVVFSALCTFMSLCLIAHLVWHTELLMEIALKELRNFTLPLNTTFRAFLTNKTPNSHWLIHNLITALKRLKPAGKEIVLCIL